MPKTQLTFLITAPSDQLLSVSNQYQIPVLNSQQLLWLHSSLLVLRILRQTELNLSDFTLVFYNNLVALLRVLGTLTIVVPSPSVSLTFAVASQRVRSTH